MWARSGSAHRSRGRHLTLWRAYRPDPTRHIPIRRSQIRSDWESHIMKRTRGRERATRRRIIIHNRDRSGAVSHAGCLRRGRTIPTPLTGAQHQPTIRRTPRRRMPITINPTMRRNIRRRVRGVPLTYTLSLQAGKVSLPQLSSGRPIRHTARRHSISTRIHLRHRINSRERATRRRIIIHNRDRSGAVSHAGCLRRGRTIPTPLTGAQHQPTIRPRSSSISKRHAAIHERLL